MTASTGATPQQYPRIRVRGSAAARAHQYGAAAAPQIRIIRDGYERAFAAKGIDWAAAVSTARSYLPAIETHLPLLLDEIRGIAAGSGLGFDDILTINCRTEILNGATAAGAVRAAGKAAGECTSFALEADRTAWGTPGVGQNWDWLESLQRGAIVLEVERTDGPNYVTLVEAGLLAKMMLTATGLAVGINTLVSSLDGAVQGVPFHFMIRALADAEHVPAALESLARFPRASSGNYVFAGADGAVLNVETAPGDAAGVRAQLSDTGAVAHSNHFIDPVAGGHDLAPLALADSYFRLGRITRSVVQRTSPVTEDELRTALSDHAGYPNSVCCHPDTAASPDSRWKTLATVLLRPSERTLTYAAGPACEHAWETIDYSEFLRARPVLPAA
ncbi:C45 family autoproteolytic acyltransferase/hydolase [Leucobacter luti]|uniref:Isopenicillin-N N-acyltransferase-like protein n=1 Tax=Leucobacter luti TaxID=340320 RepID=A0A4Q7U580_9MICO|nr:C45 family peptidase [Leucobacter luti]MBL3700571.1 hypothetical protein [Leucobacter luti]RZT68593.1 isopenicillin-N N-acyltransferase-like protein [Leucobacter luti]